MTVKELHIGLDLAFQQLNSNLFNRLEEEDKDFIINDGLVNYVNELVHTPSAQLVTSFSEISTHYSKIHSLLSYYNLPIISNEGNYLRCKLPVSNMVNEDGLITAGMIIQDGVTYKVAETGGTLNLSPYGGSPTSSGGAIFKCNLGYVPVIDNEITLEVGKEYLIENTVEDQSESYFRKYVTVSNIYTDIVYPTTKYKVLSTPFLLQGCSLIPINSIGFFDILRLEANIETDNVQYDIATIERNKYYKVSCLDNVTVNLSGYGGYSQTTNTVVFKATQSGSVALPLSASLIECKNIPVRIVKNEDVEGELNDSYGVTSSSLIAEILESEVLIYSTDKIVLNYATMAYVKQPAKVSYEYNITSDLPVKSHSELLRYVVAKTTQDYMMKNAAATGQMPQQGNT